MRHLHFGRFTYLTLIGLVVLAWAYFATRTVDVAEHNRRIDLLLQLQWVEGEIDRNALLTTSFLLNQYDPFVNLGRQLDTLLQQLRTSDSGLPIDDRQGFRDRLDGYADELARKRRMLEHLKSRAALVRNGLHYLPTPVLQLHQTVPEIGASLVQILNALYRYNLFAGDMEKGALLAQLDKVAEAAGAVDPQSSLSLVIQHMRSLLRYMSEMQELRDAYIGVPTRAGLEQVRMFMEQRFAVESGRQEIFSRLLLLLTMALFLALGHAFRRVAQAQRKSDNAWSQLNGAVQSLTEAFALYSSEGRLILHNDRYQALYPCLSGVLAPGVSHQRVQAELLRHGVRRAARPGPGGGDASADQPESYIEESPGGRWYLASDSRTPDGELACVRVDITESKRSELQLRTLYRALEHSPASVMITDADGVIEYVNPRFEEITGYSEREVLGQTPEFLRTGSDSVDGERAMWRQVRAGETWRGQYAACRKDGSSYWEEASISPVRDADGHISHFIAVKEDISERKEAEERLRLSATVFQTTTEAIMVTDAHNRIAMVNPAFSRITGYGIDEIIGQDPRILRSGRHDHAFYAAFWDALQQHGAWSGEIWNRRKDGSVYPEWLSVAVIRDTGGGACQYVAVFSDITRRKRDEEQIRHQANYDALTGLPNRVLLIDRLTGSLLSARREGWLVALVFIDLDRFKEVNDTLGHVVGDELLQMVAVRLGRCVRDTDTVARFGGDEFVIVLEDIRQASDAALVSEKILSALHEPFHLRGREVYIGASIGVTLYPEDTEDPDTMLRNADMAMYRAKESGRNNYRFFTLAMNQAVQNKVEMEHDLRNALERDELRLHYQPIVSVADGRILGVEALLRWQHPQHGLVMPDRFVPLAEETALIAPIGRWVLETACAQVAQWREQSMELSVNVNLSSRQLMLGLQVDEVSALLQRYRLPGSALHLEITESLMLDENRPNLEWLRAVHDLGVVLVVDDFGTGYSSLSYLKRFPMNTLKIDREFIRDLPDDDSNASLVRAIVAMARSLGLTVVAEGVETGQQQAFLQNVGCDLMQGFLIDRAMAPEAFAQRYPVHQGE